MKIVGQDKPSLEDALQHYGVLGMKWGRTRMKGSTKDIRKAENRLRAKQQAIYNQEDKRDLTPNTGKQREIETAKLNKMMRDYDKSPDRVLASRMTRGEKAVLAVLSIPTFGIPYVMGVAATSAASRRIERKQETGAYDKKKYNN